MMTLGRRGEVLIKSFEALSLVAYLPTPQDKPTIGWGHTKNVKMGDKITPQRADELFRSDVEWACEAVRKTGAVLTQSMFDALVSLVFNCGVSPIMSGMVIGKELELIRDFATPPLIKPSHRDTLVEESYFKVWCGFSLWRKQSGRDLLGLARRRAQEMVLFFEDGLPK